MSKGGGTAIGKGYQRIGVMACVLCAREIPVKRTDGGKLSCCCTWCDLPLYVNPRTEAFELAMKRVKLDAAPAVEERPADRPPPAAAVEDPNKRVAKDDTAPPPRSFTGPLGNPFGR